MDTGCLEGIHLVLDGIDEMLQVNNVTLELVRLAEETLGQVVVSNMAFELLARRPKIGNAHGVFLFPLNESQARRKHTLAVFGVPLRNAGHYC